MAELLDRLGAESVEPASASRICRGTLLSRNQYCGDVEMWGYIDARHAPHGSMTAEDAKNWTAAADAPANSYGPARDRDEVFSSIQTESLDKFLHISSAHGENGLSFGGFFYLDLV
jgi:hypothetical protein